MECLSKSEWDASLPRLVQEAATELEALLWLRDRLKELPTVERLRCVNEVEGYWEKMLVEEEEEEEVQEEEEGEAGGGEAEAAPAGSPERAADEVAAGAADGASPPERTGSGRRSISGLHARDSDGSTGSFGSVHSIRPQPRHRGFAAPRRSSAGWGAAKHESTGSGSGGNSVATSARVSSSWSSRNGGSDSHKSSVNFDLPPHNDSALSKSAIQRHDSVSQMSSVSGHSSKGKRGSTFSDSTSFVPSIGRGTSFRVRRAPLPAAHEVKIEGVPIFRPFLQCSGDWRARPPLRLPPHAHTAALMLTRPTPRASPGGTNRCADLTCFPRAAPAAGTFGGS